jgi:N-acyl-D-amino-acid deacylase
VIASTRLAALLTAATLVGCNADAPAPEFDLILRGGTVVDGSGGAALRADVGIRDGRIAEIGTLADRRSTRTVDVAGRVVAPGFIDLHSHADLIVLAPGDVQWRLLEAKLHQGVTTLVVGNCGLGVAPADGPTAALLAGVNGWMTPEGVEPGPLSIAGYLDRLERDGTLMNVATLVPHGPVRLSVMGLAPGEPSATQLERMAGLVEQGLEDGAFGLSFGLIYPPGMYSATNELVELARVAAPHDALVTAHVRGSSETLLDATAELVAVAERSGARTHHSHMEAVGEAFWPSVPAMIEIEDRARRDGLRISHDVFPYTRAATMMTAIFPPWALEGGVDALLDRLRDTGTRERIRRDVEQRRPEWPPWVEGGWPHNLVGAVGWDGIVVASLATERDSGRIGRSLAELAAESGRDPFDVVVELMLEQRGRVGQQVREVSGRDGDLDALTRILTHPDAAIVSDAEDYGRGAPHPAHAGAFARAIRWNREHGWMPLEELVRRMTGYPAALLGLTDRGRLRPGAAADLVVFDPERVTDLADWSTPRRHAAGFDLVVIDGTIVLGEGAGSHALPGRVLRAGPGGSVGSGVARFDRSVSPSGVSAITRTMRSEAWPSP